MFEYEVTSAPVGINFSAVHTNFQLILQGALTPGVKARIALKKVSGELPPSFSP